MTNTDVTLLASKALSYLHLGTCEAIERVVGKFTEENKDLHSAVFDELEEIMYPHGKGEDAAYYEY
ncbi:hypothetical protein XaC1_67 [Xanthomonas phage XaC1]|nr:hypothetical protein XaC1_67 [Xanthomonas phage XaC1]